MHIVLPTKRSLLNTVKVREIFWLSSEAVTVQRWLPCLFVTGVGDTMPYETRHGPVVENVTFER
jgi:hypothetical protein